MQHPDAPDGTTLLQLRFRRVENRRRFNSTVTGTTFERTENRRLSFEKIRTARAVPLSVAEDGSTSERGERAVPQGRAASAVVAEP